MVINLILIVSTSYSMSSLFYFLYGSHESKQHSLFLHMESFEYKNDFEYTFEYKLGFIDH